MSKGIKRKIKTIDNEMYKNFIKNPGMFVLRRTEGPIISKTNSNTLIKIISK